MSSSVEGKLDQLAQSCKSLLSLVRALEYKGKASNPGTAAFLSHKGVENLKSYDPLILDFAYGSLANAGGELEDKQVSLINRCENLCEEFQNYELVPKKMFMQAPIPEMLRLLDTHVDDDILKEQADMVEATKQELFKDMRQQ